MPWVAELPLGANLCLSRALAISRTSSDLRLLEIDAHVALAISARCAGSTLEADELLGSARRLAIEGDEPYRDMETLAWMTGGDSLSRHPDVRLWAIDRLRERAAREQAGNVQLKLLREYHVASLDWATQSSDWLGVAAGHSGLLHVALESGDRDLEWRSRLGLAEIHSAQGNLAAAEKELAVAAQLIEQDRDDFAIGRLCQVQGRSPSKLVTTPWLRSSSRKLTAACIGRWIRGTRLLGRPRPWRGSP